MWSSQACQSKAFDRMRQTNLSDIWPKYLRWFPSENYKKGTHSLGKYNVASARYDKWSSGSISLPSFSLCQEP